MLKESTAHSIIEKGFSHGADFVDIFIEKNQSLILNLKSSKIEQISDGIDFGLGIRVVFGEKALYGYTNSTELDELIRITNYLCELDRRNPKNFTQNFNLMKTPNYSQVRLGLDKAVKIEEKITFLRQIDQKTREQSALISQVMINSLERLQTVEIFNSEGLHAQDQRFYTRIGSSAVASDGGKQSSAFHGPGGFGGWEYTEQLNPQMIAETIAKRALTTLNADPCPAGKMPVIIDHGFGGVIFHEACGHLLETTSVEKKASVFWDKMGEKIAHSAVNAVDDGTVENGWGSINIDDEGMATQRTQLIKDGVLQSFMVDRMGEIKTGFKRTGSGRKQSYRYAPASRMRNTFIEGGKHTLEELIASVPNGLYAKSMGGGSVKPGTGEFNFSVEEGYIIKNGKIDKAVKGATLIGTGPETLTKISMVGNNFSISAGMCGSVSGSIPASVGQAAIKVDEILVGGAA
ncbi:MAG: TldD/PmbA family protein [Bacteriovoracaceae bacterium]